MAKSSGKVTLAEVLKELGAEIIKSSQDIIQFAITPKWEKGLNLNAVLLNFYRLAKCKVRRLAQTAGALFAFQVDTQHHGLVNLTCLSTGEDRFEIKFA